MRPRGSLPLERHRQTDEDGRVRSFIKQETRVYRRYLSIHGPLLAKGLSFSALFALIPLLFIASIIGSILLTPELQNELRSQIILLVSSEIAGSLIESIDRLPRMIGSLSIVSVVVFIWSAQQLFFDLHRVVCAAFDVPVTPARGRLRAIGLTAFFLLLVYSALLFGVIGRYLTRYLELPTVLMQLATQFLSWTVVALVLWSFLRIAGGRSLPFRISASPIATAAIVWQTAAVLSGAIIRGSTRRVIIYGVLASAVILLTLVRIYAEILLHTALWIHERSRE